eukprot:scaffold248141_cov36-Tisochrysis_lutea.AAC.1
MVAEHFTKTIQSSGKSQTPTAGGGMGWGREPEERPEAGGERPPSQAESRGGRWYRLEANDVCTFTCGERMFI